ncbi:MAG: NAD(P)/FAD-dependent oxidoreductase [Saprospiraceae bacterium]
MSSDWKITIVDKEERHYYQPGFLFVPFDIYKPEQTIKPIEQYIPKKANLVKAKIDKIDKDNNQVLLQNGKVIDYDILIIATGSHIVPDEIEGMNGEQWQKDIFDFYSYEGSSNLRQKLMNWKGGKLVVHICEMPIKCPVAPLEFAFLADSFFKNKRMRDKVDITFVTPMDGAFTKPVATKALNHLLKEKNIRIVPNFNIERVDTANNKIIDYGEEEVEYDLLVTVPTNMGDEAMERSGFGDDLNFVPTDKHTLQSKIKENIFVIGDATNVPASKAGSVAHFEAEILTENILRYINNEPLKADFDGHSNCFIETGNGKAILIDFNYEYEPVSGTFPIPNIGPLRLLKESRANHLGKLAFRWVYWNMLLKGRPIPFVSPQMNKKGKQLELAEV